MEKLVTDLANRENIDLKDNIYDWNVRATVIKSYPHVFDFI
jgi:hypothetical protein